MASAAVPTTETDVRTMCRRGGACSARRRPINTFFLWAAAIGIDQEVAA